MGTVASNEGGGNFQRLEGGTYAGRCYGVIDIGTQRGEYQGKETFKHQTILLFETPMELLEDGRPFGLSAFYTLSLHENSALRPALESWRGKPFTEAELKGFEVASVLGHACMLTVTLTDKGRNRVVGIGKPMKGLGIPEAVNPLVHFDLDRYLADNPAEVDKFNNLPEWIQNKIRESEEMKGGKSCGQPEPSMPEDTRDEDEMDEPEIPF